MFVTARHQPVVGRQAELATFQQLWGDVEQGRRQTVFIGGEPGVGKTRLLAEVAGALADDDVTVLVGHAVSDPGVSYRPFVEMLDRLFGDTEPGALAALIEPSQAAQLARLSGLVARHVDIDGSDLATGGVRRDLFDAVSGLFGALCVDRPLALLFDDLHWAQLPALALLQHVVTSCAATRLLVVATFRSTVAHGSDDLAAVITELHRLDGVRRLDLAGLDAEAITEYVQIRGGVSREAARASASVLREWTGGNAFLLRELWVDAERRGGISSFTRAPEHVAATVPPSIVDMVGARIDALGERLRGVAELAAVIGPTFDVATLAAGCDGGVEVVLAFVDAAHALGLIETIDAPGARYAFVHALTRQAVLDRLAPSRRMRLHARAAEALEAQPAGASSVARLADHYLAACSLGHHEPAYRHAIEAGDLAVRGLAFEEAAQWFERAGGISEITPDARAEAQREAAANWVRAGRFSVAREHYRRLAADGAPRTRLHAAIGYEDTNWRPGRPDPHAVGLLTSAIREAALPDDDPLLARAMGSLGRALAFAGERQRSQTTGERAIELARAGDDATLVHALTTSLWHGVGPDMIATQLERTTELATLAEHVGDGEAAGAAANFRGMLAYLRGDLAGVERARADIQRAARATGQPYFDYIHGCVMQALSFLRGDFAEARRWADEALTRDATFGDDMAEGPHGVQRYLIARATGDLDRFRPYLRGDEALEGRWIAGLLALYTELGVTAGIDRILDGRFARGLSDRADQAHWSIELVFAVEAALATRRRALAEELRDQVAAFDGCNLAGGALVAVFGSANRYLARIDALLGRAGDAEDHFEAALALDTAMGAVVHQAETLAHHAVFAAEHRHVTRAGELAARARALATPIGQRRVLRVVGTVPVARGRTADTAFEGPDPLTGRELDVLRLLADGLSNREIGERLCISANTAANHVRSILSKTGAANRTQAAIFAARHEIV